MIPFEGCSNWIGTKSWGAQVSRVWRSASDQGDSIKDPPGYPLIIAAYIVAVGIGFWAVWPPLRSIFIAVGYG